MLISHPFHTDAIQDDDENAVRYSFTGGYPVNSFLEWHNGVHLIAPHDAGKGYAPVRAVADGTLVHLRPPQTVANPQQNYGAFSDQPEWTDNGMVIVEHVLEIGANNVGPISITFYSVYMHLKSIAKFKEASSRSAGPERELRKGDRLFRKDKLGEAGQIYGQDAHLHFEICMDGDNLKKLIGREPATLQEIDTAPTNDGRTDAVWGSTYIYLPAGTPVSTTEPRTHTGTATTSTLGTALWLEIAYAGNATLTSYFANGDKTGEPIHNVSGASCIIEPDGEYDLYLTADVRHASLRTAPQCQGTRSGWYDLLRFGRAIEPNTKIATGTEHWRKIKTPSGDRWANLNAPGTFKFSDADFLPFSGWQCIGDDADGGNALDQRCDSPTLRALLARQIADLTQRASALCKTSEGRRTLALQASQPRTEQWKRRLRRLVCKFPSEFDRDTFEARYAHVKEEPHFKNDEAGKNWEQLQAHISAICCADLPIAYKNAQWHFHPGAFINTFNKCAWIQKSDLKRIFAAIADDHLQIVRVELNQCSSRHFLTNSLRQSHFFGQARQEAGPAMAATSESLNYPPSALKTIFKYYRNQPLEADIDGYEKNSNQVIIRPAKQEAIANKVYGARNGNDKPGDGWLYRGRGMKQVTGKKNYSDFCSYYDALWEIGYQDFKVFPDLLAQMPYSLRSAVWFWIANSCAKRADLGVENSHVDSVTLLVNPGELGRQSTDGTYSVGADSPAQKRRNYTQETYRIMS